MKPKAQREQGDGDGKKCCNFFTLNYCPLTFLYQWAGMLCCEKSLALIIEAWKVLESWGIDASRGFAGAVYLKELHLLCHLRTKIRNRILKMIIKCFVDTSDTNINTIDILVLIKKGLGTNVTPPNHWGFSCKYSRNMNQKTTADPWKLNQ